MLENKSKGQSGQRRQQFQHETRIGAGMKALNTHLLQLTVDRLDDGTVLTDQAGILT